MYNHDPINVSPNIVNPSMIPNFLFLCLCSQPSKCCCYLLRRLFGRRTLPKITTGQWFQTSPQTAVNKGSSSQLWIV